MSLRKLVLLAALVGLAYFLLRRVRFVSRSVRADFTRYRICR